MNIVKEKLPQMATSEGIWEGIYIYTDSDGKEVGRHRSCLTHIFPEDHPDEYHQVNRYDWEDGKSEEFKFKFKLDEEAAKDGVYQLSWKNERSHGLVWEEPIRVGELSTIRVSWHRSEIEGYAPYDIPYATLHEIISQEMHGDNRARVWQWLVDGEIVGRTLIKEKRVA